MAIRREQFRFVLIVEAIIVLAICLFAFGFWQSLCGSSWSSCLSEGALRPTSFLLLSMFRPFLFTPIMVLAWIGGESFGVYLGTILTAVGCVLSCAMIYFPAKYLGRQYVKPWLSSNLPSTYRLLRTQDYKVVLLMRLIPFFPYDLMSLFFGVADYRWKAVFLGSLIGVIPEIYIFSRFTALPEVGALGNSIATLGVLSVVIILPLLIYEVLYRGSGASLWMRLKRSYREIILELHVNNEIKKRRNYDPNKIPVILLYGFFSSRRSMLILERLLTARGFEVMSFNLGGLFGVFFTRGVEETARFIEAKIERQIQRFGFKKVHIVAHSKGGLVGLWWISRLGGSRYCDRLVTMGTPFKGTYLTYIALMTPLGFFWKDVWQMRPNSQFLRELNDIEIPSSLSMYCMHSVEDKVCVGENGLFSPHKKSTQVISVPMNHVKHFEFLYRRDVGDMIARLLNGARDEEKPSKALESK
jgi:triacylglycerol lipase